MLDLFAATLSGVTIPKVEADEMALASVLTWVYMIIGVVTVAFIIVGGIRYAISSGEPSKVKQAKDTITYAIVGLVMVILAYAITQFVVQSVNGSSWESLRDSVINTLIWAVGIISVIMIITAGIRYTLSIGDEKKIETAKLTIQYAVLGLVIAIVAYAIVNFVLGSL